MTTILPPNERALQVLQSNRYFVLATIDENGPWAAALAFTPALPARLYFISRTWARHSKAVERDSRVAGVIYDSSVPAEAAECIQFSGTCQRVFDRNEIRIVLKGHPANKGEDPDDNAVQELLDDSEQAAYRVSIENAYVLDQVAWLEHQIDARQPTEIREVFATFLKSFEQG